MGFTRRYWTTVGLAAVLALWAIVLESPTLLIGSTGVGAWLLAQQYRFVRAARETVAGLTVEQRLDRTRVTAQETTLGTLAVKMERPAVISVSVRGSLPIGSDATTPTCRLQPDETTSQTTFEATWPVAGSFEFGEPAVTLQDTLGLFSQTLQIGSTPTVTVEPRAPRDIHVGEGGDRVAAGFGEHDTGYTGSGLTPAEIRKYVPGDTIRQIDWKATARLNEPHIREFEAETDLETMLIVDHRATMATGREGEQKLDFARQVALAFVDDAHELNDPFGCYTVGDGGLTTVFEPSTSDGQYQTIAQRLRALEPDSATDGEHSGRSVDPARARRMADSLSADDPFGERLGPFFGSAETYVQRIAERPLFGAVRTAAARRGGAVRTIIITDDQHRTELRESVKVASGGDGHVSVFLTPTVLYESQPLQALDDAYQQYTSFESFRRDLASLARVSAFEVGPSDRLSSVLSAGTRQRQQRTGL